MGPDSGDCWWSQGREGEMFMDSCHSEESGGSQLQKSHQKPGFYINFNTNLGCINTAEQQDLSCIF